MRKLILSILFVSLCVLSAQADFIKATTIQGNVFINPGDIVYATSYTVPRGETLYIDRDHHIVEDSPNSYGGQTLVTIIKLRTIDKPIVVNRLKEEIFLPKPAK